MKGRSHPWHWMVTLAGGRGLGVAMKEAGRGAEVQSWGPLWLQMPEKYTWEMVVAQGAATVAEVRRQTSFQGRKPGETEGSQRPPQGTEGNWFGGRNGEWSYGLLWRSTGTIIFLQMRQKDVEGDSCNWVKSHTSPFTTVAWFLLNGIELSVQH